MNASKINLYVEGEAINLSKVQYLHLFSFHFQVRIRRRIRTIISISDWLQYSGFTYFHVCVCVRVERMRRNKQTYTYCADRHTRATPCKAMDFHFSLEAANFLLYFLAGNFFCRPALLTVHLCVNKPQYLPAEHVRLYVVCLVGWTV